MLTAAQEAHPVVPELSRHSHTFKHPYAKPEAAPSAPPAAAAAVAVAAADEQQAETMQDDGSSDESPAPKRRARTASDLEAVAMNDHCMGVVLSSQSRVPSMRVGVVSQQRAISAFDLYEADDTAGVLLTSPVTVQHASCHADAGTVRAAALQQLLCEVVRKSSDKDKRVLRTARKEAKHIKSTKKRRKKMAGF
eukprot:8614-Heterococcus_DN1.PRE.2